MVARVINWTKVYFFDKQKYINWSLFLTLSLISIYFILNSYGWNDEGYYPFAGKLITLKKLPYKDFLFHHGYLSILIQTLSKSLPFSSDMINSRVISTLLFLSTIIAAFLKEKNKSYVNCLLFLICANAMAVFSSLSYLTSASIVSTFSCCSILIYLFFKERPAYFFISLSFLIIACRPSFLIVFPFLVLVFLCLSYKSNNHYITLKNIGYFLLIGTLIIFPYIYIGLKTSFNNFMYPFVADFLDKFSNRNFMYQNVLPLYQNNFLTFFLIFFSLFNRVGDFIKSPRSGFSYFDQIYFPVVLFSLFNLIMMYNNISYFFHVSLLLIFLSIKIYYDKQLFKMHIMKKVKFIFYINFFLLITMFILKILNLDGSIVSINGILSWGITFIGITLKLSVYIYLFDKFLNHKKIIYFILIMIISIGLTYMPGKTYITGLDKSINFGLKNYKMGTLSYYSYLKNSDRVHIRKILDENIKSKYVYFTLNMPLSAEIQSNHNTYFLESVIGIYTFINKTNSLGLGMTIDQLKDKVNLIDVYILDPNTKLRILDFNNNKIFKYENENFIKISYNNSDIYIRKGLLINDKSIYY